MTFPGSVVRDAGLFLAMAAIWGTTWIASAIGLKQVPPLLFAAARYLGTATILLAVTPGVRVLFTRGVWRRTVITGLLTNAVTYSLLFWALTVAPSGIIGLVDLALTPLVLYLLAVVLREERLSLQLVCGLALGVAGLIVTCTTRSSWTSGSSGYGILAAVIAAFAYGLGSVLSRPLLDRAGPLAVTAAQATVAGPALLLASAIFEPVTPAGLLAFTDVRVLAALAYLVGPGTIAAFSIYLSLLRNWGPARAGLYAFVSPVIALVVGAVLLHERVAPGAVVGAGLMLAAAGFVLHLAKPAALNVAARPL